MDNIDQKIKDHFENFPESLYKYRAFNNGNRCFVEEIFLQNKIYFAAPKDLNDPVDSIAPYSYDHPPKMWRKHLRSISKEHLPNLNREQRF